MQKIIDAVVLEARAVEVRTFDELNRLTAVLGALPQDRDTLDLRLAFIDARSGLLAMLDKVEQVHTRRWAARTEVK